MTTDPEPADHEPRPDPTAPIEQKPSAPTEPDPALANASSDDPRSAPVEAPHGAPDPSLTPIDETPAQDKPRITLGQITHYLFTPVLWIVRPFVFRIGAEKGTPKVYLTSYSTLMYLWPIMVVGLVNNWLLHWSLAGPAVLGWIWITVVLCVIVCLGADIDRNKMIFIALLVAVLWLGGLLIDERAQIPVLSHVYAFLASQNVQFEPGTARIISIATFMILVGVAVLGWFDGRYEITTREITHRRVFFTSDSLPRAAKRVKRDWRDLAEVILGCGAGDLIVIDSNKNVVMRIPNIPFLWFFRHDIDHVLEVLATTEVAEAAAIEESEIG